MGSKLNKDLIREWYPLVPEKSIIKESTLGGKERILLKGILQKANTLNQNGRIYPKEILQREIRNYQKFILEDRAMGECVDIDTKIFTKRGWLSFNELKDDDIVFTLDTETGNLCEEEIIHITQKAYSGKMFHFKNTKSLDMKVTPDHKMLIYDRHGNLHELKAHEVYKMYKENSSWLSHSSIRFTSEWNGNTPEIYTIPGTGIDIDPNIWAAFLGIYISEGCAGGSKSGKYNNIVQITQKKKENKILIRDLLKESPFDFKEHVRKDGETVDFKISNKGLHRYLVQLGHSHTKRIPKKILSWNKEQLEILLTWLLIGDGRNRTIRGKLLREYCTTSPKLAQDVNELFLKLGVGSNSRSYIQKDREIEKGRMILSENSKPMWIISENYAKNIGLDLRFVTIDVVDHNDKVYCVTTGNGNWMAKRNGKMFWTGNCDHPDSAVVSLVNVSHVVREARMEGDIVYGTIEILNTPKGKLIKSLIEDGVTLGISSRGVGSVQNVNGNAVVQDDFQLICFDMVSEPSTPGAFMLSEGINRSDLDRVFNLTDKIDRIFNDILEW